MVLNIGKEIAALKRMTVTELRKKHVIGKLEAETRALERELKRHSTELRKLAAQAGQDGVTTDRMADLQDRIRTAEQRATEVREQVIALSRELVDAREVAEACSLFGPLWETLTAREQARILHLLIERVDYDGQNGTVSITFRPTGIKALADELSQQEVAA